MSPLDPLPPTSRHGTREPIVATRDPAILALILVCCAIYALRASADMVASGGQFSGAVYLRDLLKVLAVYTGAVLAVLGVARIAPRRTLPRALALSLAVMAGCAVGSACATGWIDLLAAWERDGPWLLTTPLRYSGIGLLGVALFLLAERDAAAREALDAESLRRMELEQATVEARMAVLRSQVEPHFLFNVLAHLRRLYATDARAARSAMADLVRYLGDARPALERDSIPLREDARLALSYLNLQRMRMGTRLDFELDLAPEAEDAGVPPMALTILLENAIEHGLLPRPAGGRILIRGGSDGDRVRIDVIDDGIGLGSGVSGDVGSGVGLSNLRARLRALYGTEASLVLRNNEQGGVTATVTVPRQPRPAG